MTENPFTQRKMIRDLAHFYGRTEELHHACEHIKHGECCSIVGEPKIGKSSFLWFLHQVEALSKIGVDPEKYLTVYFDFQLDLRITQLAFWRALLTQLAEKLKDELLSREILQLSRQPGISFTDLRSIMKQIVKKDHRIVFLFDEFECVAENRDAFDRSFLSALRSLANDLGITYVTATRSSLPRVFPEDQTASSPFFNIFTEIRLGLLQSEEVKNLILQTKKPVEPCLSEEQGYILREAGRHPYILQVLCYHVFHLKTTRGSLGEGDLEEAAHRSYDQLYPVFEHMWRKMEDSHRDALRAIACPKPGVSVHPTILRELERLGYVVAGKEHPSIFCELFEGFVNSLQVEPALKDTFSLPRTRRIGGREYWLPEGVNREILSFLISRNLLDRALQGIEAVEDRLFVVLGGRQYDERLGEARKLLADMWNTEIGLIPYLFVETLSNFEFDRTFYRGYRDHITHQLRVYLLGLYLYYGNSRLQNAVNREFQDAVDPQGEFLRSWQPTAIFHDLGYVFEVGREKRSEAYGQALREINHFLEAPLFAYCRTHGIPLLKAQEHVIQERIGLPSHRLDSIRDIEMLKEKRLLDQIDALVRPAQLSSEPGGLQHYYNYARSNDPYDAVRTSFFDHGITSALTLLYLSEFFQEYTTCVSEAIQRGNIDTNLAAPDTLQALIRLAEASRGWHETINHASAAIALHNIQIDLWDPEEAWRAERLTLDQFNLSLDGTPLAFLLALTDILQDWDRPLFSAPAGNLEYISQDQDISIRFSGDQIVLSYPTDEFAGTSQSKFRRLMKELKKCMNGDDIDSLLVEGAEQN